MRAAVGLTVILCSLSVHAQVQVEPSGSLATSGFPIDCELELWKLQQDVPDGFIVPEGHRFYVTQSTGTIVIQPIPFSGDGQFRIEAGNKVLDELRQTQSGVNRLTTQRTDLPHPIPIEAGQRVDSICRGFLVPDQTNRRCQRLSRWDHIRVLGDGFANVSEPGYFSFTVPDGRVWFVALVSSSTNFDDTVVPRVRIDGELRNLFPINRFQSVPLRLQAGQTLEVLTSLSAAVLFYEYDNDEL